MVRVYAPPPDSKPDNYPGKFAININSMVHHLQLRLQQAATHRFVRIEKPFAVGLTQENPCLLAKQTILSEANALTKKIGVNGTSLSVV